MKLHDRYFLVREAKNMLSHQVLDLIKDRGLTPHEIVAILLEEAQTWTKHGIRAERHPEDTERKGDEA